VEAAEVVSTTEAVKVPALVVQVVAEEVAEVVEQPLQVVSILVEEEVGVVFNAVLVKQEDQVSLF
tara:strand:- start:27 stop:221 length:195 start_codon:yes stop_codon:yes gene_type:complete